jgi:hypothetical protein
VDETRRMHKKITKVTKIGNEVYHIICSNVVEVAPTKEKIQD